MAVTVRDSYTTDHNNNRELRRTSSQQRLAQTYLTTSAYQITRIDTWLYRANSPVGDIWMEIYATSGGVPTGSALATSDTIDVSTIDGGAQEQIAFTFSTPYEVADATTYAMALTGDWTIDGSNFVWEYEHHIGAYADGAQYWWDGADWNVQTNDWWFEVRGDDIAGEGATGFDLFMGKTVAQIDLFMKVPMANINSIFGVPASIPPAVVELQDNFAASSTLANIGGVGGAFAQGNTFTPSMTYNIASVAFVLDKQNSPTGSCWYEIRNWNATTAKPTDLIARTTGMDVSALPTTATWVGKQWIATPAITSGKIYALSAKVDFAAGANNVGQYYKPGNNYASGLQIYQLYTASAWNTADNDFAFRSYGKDA